MSFYIVQFLCIGEMISMQAVTHWGSHRGKIPKKMWTEWLMIWRSSKCRLIVLLLKAFHFSWLFQLRVSLAHTHISKKEINGIWRDKGGKRNHGSKKTM